MSILATIGAFLQIVLLFFKTMVDRDAERKKKKQEILKEAQDALKNKDTSALTASLDKLNRM